MPLFEFTCKKCKEKFEILVLAKGKIECPRCKSDEVTKQFSRFSLLSSSNCSSADFCLSATGNKHKCQSERCHRH